MIGPREWTVVEALAKVMGDVQAVGKGDRADLGNGRGYSFRGVDAVVNAVGPSLREHGVIVLPRVLDKQYREYATRNGGQMHEAIIEVEYTFVGPDASKLVCSAVGEASDSGDKATPKAMSVAYRTALLQALCIPTDEPDPDEHVVERAPAQDPAAIAAQRTLLVEVQSAMPGESDEKQRQRAREVWDEFGQDPKRLTEMTERVKADTNAQ